MGPISTIADDGSACLWKSTQPATLILHGYEEQTWISLADCPGRRADGSLVTAIQRALAVKNPASISFLV
jgi:hypothetical protein